MISKIPRWVLLGGGVLAFAAGMINAIALLGFAGRAATHVTGIFSHMSIAFSRGDLTTVQQALLILFSFLIGAVLSGIMIRDAQLKLDSRYSWALAVECVLLLLSTGEFTRGSILGECFASMAAGLQNAMASTYSGAIIRTTHLTGVMTDLGVLIGHYFHGLPVDLRRVKLFLTLIISFTLGGFLGAVFFRYYGVMAMLAPAAVIGMAAISFNFFQRSARKK